MKKLLIITTFIFSVTNLLAGGDSQTSATTEQAAHRIIFQMTSGDTLAHKMLMKQLNNITTVAPGSQLEVVCHGPGLDMIMKEKTIVQDKIKELKAAGVSFVACEFAMKERKVLHEQIIPEAGFVKAGIIEIVSKQEEGWSYIKSGF